MTEKNNVLVVDDSQAIRSYMQAILSTEGWFDEVVVASSVDEAIGILDNSGHKIGWVFGDWELEGTPSQALLDHIRERFSKDELLFVMMTDRQAKQLATQSLPSNINDCLSKPFEPNVLLNIIRRQRGLPERRVAERVIPSEHYEASMMIGNEMREADLVNISTSGCLLTTDRFRQGECSVYDVIEIYLHLSGEQLSPLEVEIVRIERDKSDNITAQRVQVAVNFPELAEENRQRLAGYIEACVQRT